jgi:hypothetical protein
MPATFIGLTTLAACQPPPPSAEVPSDFGDCPVTYFDEEIPVPAVHVTPGVFRFGAHVPLTVDGIAVDIEDTTGTVSVDDFGPMPAFVFRFVDWPDIGRRLFQGLAVRDGVWFPFWLYCRDDGTLDGFWAERTDYPVWKGANVNGTWVQSAEISTAVIDLPATTLRKVALTCGFDVSTPAGVAAPLNVVGSHPGTMAFPGYSPTTLLVFNTADCRTGCGSRSWFELHAIAWNRERDEVSFQILYLEPSVRGVAAANTVVLPDVTSLDTAFPDATWHLRD